MTATTADGLHYITMSRDNVIMKTMYNTQRNWAETEMKLFHELAKKYFDVDDSNGWFLDLGANIGTTGIYFLKKITPNLKLLAFEPDPENFKMLRTNLILNDMEEKAVIENYGLGVEENTLPIYRESFNPGASRFTPLDSYVKADTIKIIPLDKYFAEKKISPKDVKYIWIDTEGFEPQVMLGMKNILVESHAPTFMEFNPRTWQKSGYYEKMMQLLTEIYQNYIWVKEVTTKQEVNLYPIEKLWEFQNSSIDGANLGDIFLIKK